MAPEEGETARAGEGGLVVRVQLCRLQPDPNPETAGAERVKQLAQPSAARYSGRAAAETTKNQAKHAVIIMIRSLYEG
jgi:hypothetical protein